jgi:hypothetical protein
MTTQEVVFVAAVAQRNFSLLVRGWAVSQEIIGRIKRLANSALKLLGLQRSSEEAFTRVTSYHEVK